MPDHPRAARLRAAARIHQQLLATQTRADALPEVCWEESRRLVRMIHKANTHHLSLASRKLQQQLPAALRRLRDQLEDYRRRESSASELIVPTQRQVYEDLAALEQEFFEVKFDLQHGRVTASTDPIELEGVYLGPFAIVFQWHRLGETSAPFEVVAQDPHPAASHSETTHPHVQDDELCEGEARVPLRRALEQGRLLDFFLIVRQVLENYNPDSAYVALDRWDAVGCSDCGALENGQVGCDRCGSPLCLGCLVRCHECDSECCHGCIPSCHGCGEPTCHDCLSQGPQDRNNDCSECLTHAASST